MGKALVLGGGGIVGLAWEIGVLTGLRDAGVDLRDADVILGTSTGAIAAAQIVSGVALDELYERQLAPAGAEAAARPHRLVRARVAGTLLTPRTPMLGRAPVGLIAASSARFSQAVREPLLAAHLPARDWPESTHLVVTAVDARSGAVRAFSRTDGVDLLHAVAASSAVPGLWPPVAVDRRWYIDGGCGPRPTRTWLPGMNALSSSRLPRAVPCCGGNRSRSRSRKARNARGSPPARNRVPRSAGTCSTRRGVPQPPGPGGARPRKWRSGSPARGACDRAFPFPVTGRV